jgi:hypothetical protein
MEVCQIPLRNKKKEIVDYALIDADDYERLSQYKWSKSFSGYACSSNKKVRTMHRLIVDTDVPKGYVIDHINRNRLDNRKSNLRVVSQSLNLHNRCVSGVVNMYGVSLCSSNNNIYIARFANNHLGCFDDPREAAARYDICAYLTYGKHANTNGIISYEEAMTYKLEDMMSKKKKRDLPDNIYLDTDSDTTKYKVDVRTKGKRYRKQGFTTLEKAVEYLNAIKEEIQRWKKEKEEAYMKKPIERNCDGVAIIKVKDLEFLVDDDMWHTLSKMSWGVLNGKYLSGEVKGNKMTMHRFIFGADESVEVVDHINQNAFDNRRQNLRAATYAQNNQNRVITTDSKQLSPYTGVTKDTRNKTGTRVWIAKIAQGFKSIYIGIYDTPEEAAVAYNIKAREIYGEHAHTNKVDNEEELLPIVERSLTFIKKIEGSSTAYRGITLKKAGTYRARINLNGKEKPLGTFKNEIDGAIAYNIAYKFYHPQSKKIPNDIPLTPEEYAEKEKVIQERLKDKLVKIE